MQNSLGKIRLRHHIQAATSRYSRSTLRGLTLETAEPAAFATSVGATVAVRACRLIEADVKFGGY